MSSVLLSVFSQGPSTRSPPQRGARRAAGQGVPEGHSGLPSLSRSTQGAASLTGSLPPPAPTCQLPPPLPSCCEPRRDTFPWESAGAGGPIISCCPGPHRTRKGPSNRERQDPEGTPRDPHVTWHRKTPPCHDKMSQPHTVHRGARTPLQSHVTSSSGGSACRQQPGVLKNPGAGRGLTPGNPGSLELEPRGAWCEDPKGLQGATSAENRG